MKDPTTSEEQERKDENSLVDSSCRASPSFATTPSSPLDFDCCHAVEKERLLEGYRRCARVGASDGTRSSVRRSSAASSNQEADLVPATAAAAAASEEEKAEEDTSGTTDVDSSPPPPPPPPALLLITGKSGVGKTTLALQLKSHMKSSSGDGIFVNGKFSQPLGPPTSPAAAAEEEEVSASFTSNVTNYTPFVSALTQFRDILLQQAETPSYSSSNRRQRLCDSMQEDEVAILLNIVPSMKVLFSCSNLTSADDSIDDENEQKSQASYRSKQTTASEIKRRSSGSAIMAQGSTTIQNVLTKFFLTLCTLVAPAPVVFLLDDLQWVDPDSLVLLDMLLSAASKSKWSDDDEGTLIVMGTCRIEELTQDHDLSIFLRHVEDKLKRPVWEVSLSNVNETQVLQVCATLLNMPPHECIDLAKFVYRQTQGNLFMINQLVQSLSESGMLKHNLVVERYDDVNKDDEVTTTGEQDSKNNNNPEELWIVQRIQSLTPYCQVWLQIAACFGAAHFDVRLVHLAMPSSMRNSASDVDDDDDQDLEPQTQTAMLKSTQLAQRTGGDMPEVINLLTLDSFMIQYHEEAQQAGLIQPCEHGLGGNYAAQTLAGAKERSVSYRFVHDKIRQACYESIPAAERPAFHIGIGRRLWKQMSVDQVELYCLLISQQLSCGMCLVQRDKDRLAMAKLFLLTGQREGRRSHFRSSSYWLRAAIDLLPPRHWRDCYDLSLSIFLGAAESDFVLGNTRKSQSLVSEILSNARSVNDKMDAYVLQIILHGTQSRLQEAIDTGLAALKELGAPLPKRMLLLRTALSFFGTSRRLSRYSTNAGAILDLPPLDNEHTMHVMKIMNMMFVYCFLMKSEFTLLIAFRLVELTLKNGLCDLSATGFGTYAFVLSSFPGWQEKAYRYGQAALRVLDTYNGREWLPRVFFVVYGLVNPSTRPWRDSLKPLYKAHQVGLATGDLECSMFALHVYCSMRFFGTSTPLPLQYEHFVTGYQLMDSYRQENARRLQAAMAQFVANIMGRSRDPLLLTGDDTEEAELMRWGRQDEDKTMMTTLTFFKGLLFFWMNEYQKAENMFRPLTAHEVIARHYILFVRGTCNVILARMVERQRRKRTRVARKCLRLLERSSQTSPENFSHMVYFLEAHFRLLHGDLDGSIAKFEQCERVAGREGFVQIQALAQEHAGITLCERGLVEGGLQWLQMAKDLYTNWGAEIKVHQMTKRIRSLSLNN